ncbi:MAG: hypothetical protein OXJ64_16750 [Boseongicola sp.]|nr:hypothetical protein [Boseongicola sp.]
MPALPEPGAGSGPPGHVRDPCNAGLQQRIEAWRRHGVSLRCTDQTNGLKAVRDAAVPELAGVDGDIKERDFGGWPRF